MDLFNEKDVGVALREFALVFMPPGFLSGEGRAIYTYPREHATGKIIEPVVLAPQEAMRKAMLITADDAWQGGPDGSPLPYGQKEILEAFGASEETWLYCRDFSDKQYYWKVHAPWTSATK